MIVPFHTNKKSFAVQQRNRQADAAFSRLLKIFIVVQHMDEHFVREEDARLQSTDSTRPMALTSFLQCQIPEAWHIFAKHVFRAWIAMHLQFISAQLATGAEATFLCP